MSERELRATRSRGRAREWALVLSAEGIGSRVMRRGTGYALCVATEDAASAETALAAYERENAESRPGARVLREFRGLLPLNAALATAFGLLAFHAVTGPRDPQLHWFERGSADAAGIASGEIWRSVTALTLHADVQHVTANALFGTLFLAAAGRSLGPGLALVLALAAGAGGNLANAFLRGPPHVVVGASTAVFGVVGVLAGWSISHRGTGRSLARRLGTPIAAALGLLAMLGVGNAPTDVWAHLLGLACGVPLGAAAGLLLSDPPRWPAQAACAAIALATLTLSWQAALA